MSSSYRLTDLNESTIISRLTALWALNEAGLGGLLHLFKTPFSGVILAGIAVCIITMMAFFTDKPYKAISKALLIVLIIKLSISPHSPITAYLAVAFQGLLGAVMFSLFKFRSYVVVPYAILCLVESASQKIFTLTVLFGLGLWQAIDRFMDHVLGVFNFEAQSNDWGLIFIFIYLSIYFFAGVLIGFIAHSLPYKILENSLNLRSSLDENIQFESAENHRRLPLRLILSLLVLSCFYILSFLITGRDALGEIFKLVLRLSVVVVFWFFVLGPVLKKALSLFLKKREHLVYDEIDRIKKALPLMRQMALQSWKDSKKQSPFKRIPDFLIRLMSYSLFYDQETLIRKKDSKQ